MTTTTRSSACRRSTVVEVICILCAPPRLRTKTASRYGKALDLIDQGKKPEARVELEKVVAEEPGFGLATDDLVRLTQ